MPIFRTILVVVSIFLAGLYVYDSCRSDGLAMPVSGNGILARRWPEPDAFHPTAAPVSATAGTVTPAARVRETFAMFIPKDARRHPMQRSL
ncbi:hypothetical protein ACVIHI_007090 [Bradyrhizobium sp. USDA 4524]|uniref:hypothetical protein n=1 Tax=unclassified Bradyrhizobium TaxID=2631580 RepID=UPI00209EE43E|nr:MULTISPECIES: hypothetical protein [unclassified Bradyrhizobium]MCP1839993.1 hypothetical protein [Bradyrhizobium sp. USDA 4538]MCP1900556.1 hypothetical protein [Bradyrhizobium sp. USDA 4537]MCP1993788.1 hypothetical protein [Bradyrhizobium sp. USDA 4539]